MIDFFHVLVVFQRTSVKTYLMLDSMMIMKITMVLIQGQPVVMILKLVATRMRLLKKLDQTSHQTFAETTQVLDIGK